MSGAERAVYPAEPLLRAITRIAGQAGFDTRPHPSKNAPGIGSFCKAVFGDDTLCSRLRRYDRLTPSRADQLACTLKLHPYEIWGDDWLVPFPTDAREESVHRTAMKHQALREYNARKQREERQKRKESAA